MPVRIGEELLGKYRVERVLGKGGMGVVVAVRHIVLGELYAIKCLLPTALDSKEALERFLREARATARLKGEHVIRVHDVGQLATGEPYMLMDYLEGSDLKTIVRQRGKLPVDEAILYVLQACEGLGEAHAVGIVHRDIKSSNLFLCRRLKGLPCVKVLDFGISKVTGAHQISLTKTDVVVGSPVYMSPEQIAHSKRVDVRTDVWSMGVVLYELLTGTVPFKGSGVVEILLQVVQGRLVPPSRLEPQVPAALDAVVERCLCKRPEERFQSIDELARALRALSASSLGVGGAAKTPLGSLSTVDAEAPEVQTTVSSWASTRRLGETQRRRSFLAMGVGGVALVGALSAGIWLVSGRATTQQTSSQTSATAAPSSEASTAASAAAFGSAATPHTSAPAEASAPSVPSPISLKVTALGSVTALATSHQVAAPSAPPSAAASARPKTTRVPVPVPVPSRTSTREYGRGID